MLWNSTLDSDIRSSLLLIASTRTHGAVVSPDKISVLKFFARTSVSPRPRNALSLFSVNLDGWNMRATVGEDSVCEDLFPSNSRE